MYVVISIGLWINGLCVRYQHFTMYKYDDLMCSVSFVFVVQDTVLKDLIHPKPYQISSEIISHIVNLHANG